MKKSAFQKVLILILVSFVLITFSAHANTPSPSPLPTPKQVPEGENIHLPQYSVLQELLVLKDHLYLNGYYISKVPDEILLSTLLDDYTMLAVESACKHNNLPYSSYGITSEAWNAIVNGKIVNSNATPSPAPPESTYQHIFWMQQNDGVAKIQEKLQILGYGANMTRGLYNEVLREAIDTYCSINNISYDQGAAFSNGIEPWLQQQIIETDGVPYHEPEATPTTDPNLTATGEPIGLIDKLLQYFSGTEEFVGVQIPMVLIWLFCMGIIACIVIIAFYFFTPADANSAQKGSNKRTRRTHEISSGKIEFTIEYAGSVQVYRCDIQHELRIGRNVGNFPLNMNDTGISRKHCNIFYSNRNLMLRDFSSNGTFINGKECRNGAFMLNRGDVIRIGNHYITINF